MSDTGAETVQTSEQKVPRSELDAAFDVSRNGRWMVVQSVSATTWGYGVQPLYGESILAGRYFLAAALGLPKNR